VTVAARSVPVFGAASIRIAVSPRPDDGFNVTHETSADAVQLHALCVRRSTTAMPPVPGRGSDGADIV
jgi:hypothetical protein